MVAARSVTTLVALAQAVACLVLVVRRWQVENAILLLDSTNAVYAIIGTLSPCHSLLITAVGGEWKYSEGAPGEGSSSGLRTFSFLFTHVLSSFPTGLLRVQYLNFIHVSSQQYDLSLHERPITFYLLVTIMVGSLLAAGIFFVNGPGLSFYRKLISKSWRAVDILFVMHECAFHFIIAWLLRKHVVYLVASAHELAVIAQGREMVLWGVDACKWSDPWSDRLFVY